jgi:hypothetical protein
MDNTYVSQSTPYVRDVKFLLVAIGSMLSLHDNFPASAPGTISSKVEMNISIRARVHCLY